MVNRHYICSSCSYEFEERVNFSDAVRRRCPNCKKHALFQDLSNQYHSVVKEATTVIQQAERNEKNFGKYELESKRLKDKQNKEKARLEALKQMGKVKADATELPKTKKRWYNPENKNLTKELSSVLQSKEAATKYIVKGEK